MKKEIKSTRVSKSGADRFFVSGFTSSEAGEAPCIELEMSREDALRLYEDLGYVLQRKD
ncbi:MAG: hypothetical protein AB7E55_16955 [Pigmentiphaga sp.]